MVRRVGEETLVTADRITAHYGLSLEAVPAPERQRYEDYAAQATAHVEAHLYRYVDSLPLEAGPRSIRVLAEASALWYGLWCKAVDDGAPNAGALRSAWEGMDEDLIRVLQAMPQQVNTRRVVSAGYRDEVAPYSQSYGVSDIL